MVNISASFTAAQQAAFQDKPVKIRPAVEVTGGLGSVSTQAGSVSETVLANFQYVSDKLLAEEWGLTISKDAVMTRTVSCELFKGDFVQYDSTVFRVIEAIRHDSHWKWIMKATDLAVI